MILANAFGMRPSTEKKIGSLTVGGSILYALKSPIDHKDFEDVQTKKITGIDLWGCSINDLALKKMSESDWSALEFLNLKNCTINSKGCKLLVKIQGRKNFSLNLSENQIENHGILHLSKMKRKITLELSLEKNQLIYDENLARNLNRLPVIMQRFSLMTLDHEDRFNKIVQHGYVFTLLLSKTKNDLSNLLWDDDYLGLLRAFYNF